jgi:glutamyl-tRNA synthetase
VFNWLYARRHGGRFLLRIEDTDPERSRQEYTDDILDGLRWLGLDWDAEPLVQSQRRAAHEEAIEGLLARGLAYRCYVSEAELADLRERQQAEHRAPRYDNRHRHLSAEQERAFIAEGREAVIRFRIDDDAEIRWNDLVRGEMCWAGSDLGGDMVIARRAPADRIGDPLYNLVVVVDDAFMEITHVIRGEDHLANTAKQLLLYRAMGLPVPQFAHTPLILNREGRKLSKRDGVTSIGEFRAMGYTAEALVNYMTLLGWSPPEGMGERFALAEAARVFDFTRVNRAGARFDWDKLDWLNAQVLHELGAEELCRRLRPFWSERGWTEAADPAWQEELCALLGPSLTRLSDGVEQAAPFFERPEPDAAALGQLAAEGARPFLASLLGLLGSGELDTDRAGELLAEASRLAGVKKGTAMKSLRAALLGRLQGPDLLTTWRLLHRLGEDRRRIDAVLASPVG